MEPVLRDAQRKSPVTAVAIPIRARLHLQQRAPDNLRRHLLRGIRRTTVLIGADLLVLAVVAAIVWAVREQAVLGSGLANAARALLPPGTPNGWQFGLALIIACAVTGNYGQGHERRNPGRLFLGCALAAALPLWATLWTRGFGLVVAQYAVVTALVWAGLLIERLTVDRLVARVARPEQNAARTVFVGSAPDCVDAMRNPALQATSGYRGVGFIDLHTPPAAEALGHIDAFAALLPKARAEVVVVSGQVPQWRFQEVVDAALAAGCEVLLVPRAIELAGVEPTTVRRRGRVLINLTAPRLRGQQQIVKWALDVVGATVGLIVLSPLFALLAVLVKLDSPGPVFFRQSRVGRGGRFFEIIKFRTMRTGAAEQRDDLSAQNMYADQRIFKIPRDPRITRSGRWMRRASLDELPQLINVLRGEMSLVGPRPPLPSEVALYEVHHYARFDVKPGMTGPWQVSGRNDVADFEQVISLETEYIRRWSVAQDLWILCRTVPAVLARRGAH